ncbi:MAG: hypothetical protein ACE5PO_03520 [Candidatus Bathyarchaeia archaeon]
MKGLLLLSGGFDSAVAGFLLQNKDFTVVPVHFSSQPFTDDEAEAKSQKIAAILRMPGLHIVNIAKALERFANECNHRLYFVLTKRFMLRVSERLADSIGCSVLITGESVGQVSSQTLTNLTVISSAVRIPILRPLIGLNKNEIINIARTAGTHDVSIGPELCDLLGPRHPRTKAKLEEVLAEEARLDINELTAETLLSAKYIQLPSQLVGA